MLAKPENIELMAMLNAPDEDDSVFEAILQHWSTKGKVVAHSRPRLSSAAHGVHEDLKFFNNISPGFSSRASYIIDAAR